jgi:exopolysaccharide biosynthesis polyprenyl glycosylphosphotransferase
MYGRPVPVKKGDFIFNTIRVPLDFVMLLIAGVLTYLIRTDVLGSYRPVLFAPDLPLERFMLLIAGVSLIFIGVYAFSGLYAMKLRMTRGQEASRIIVASSAAIMVIILTIFLRQELFNSRFLVVGYWLAAMISVLIGRLALRVLQRHLMARYDIGVHRVMLIGSDGVTERLERTMAGDPGLGWRVVKRLADPDVAEVAAAIGNPGVHEVILANPDYPAAKIVQLVDFCHEHHLIFKFVPNIYQTLTTHYDVDAIDRIPVVELRRTALDGWGRVFKRMFDSIGSAVALVLLSPVFAAVAFAIKWETEGPVFVRLRRVSRGQEFDLLKFRSMINNAHELNAYLRTIANDRPDAGPLWKMKDDPRVTRVGKFIRKYRIDEFPQFWNVLKGEMSIVGPRPHQPDEIARYEKHHRKVLAIKAGATGMVQSSGASDMPFEEEVALDTFYIENWSLLMDLRIVIRTALRILNDRSAA